MAEYNHCVDKNCTTQELCDTEHFIGNNRSTIASDTKTEQYSEIQSKEMIDLDTPRLCNILDNTGDLDHNRPNNGIFDRLGCDLGKLDINKNSTGIKINVSEDPRLGDGGCDNSLVTFGLGVSEGSETGSVTDSTVLVENLLKMEDSVFKEDSLCKAKSDTHLDNYVSSLTKVRKLSPGELTSPSSTTNLGADVVQLRCRRKTSSGSDAGRRSRPVSEEIFSTEDESDGSEPPPCDCDECLFGGEQDIPKPPPEERKLVRKVAINCYFMQGLEFIQNYS